MNKLSIIIPAYNEIKNIDNILNQVLAVKIPLEKEIVLIESNSTDGTREYVKRLEKKKGFKIIYEDKPRGKGHAVRNGLKVATGDIILIQDADLEYKPSEYPELLEPIISGKAKFVLGSRHLGSGTWKIRKFDDNSKWKAHLINFVSVFYYTIFWLLYGVRLTDPQTMFKVFKRECLKGIRLESNYFQLDWEIVIKLVKKGYIPLEVPISYKARTFNQGKKIKIFRDGLLALWAIIKYRFAD